MRFIAGHDFYIHSTVSLCCRDKKQTPETILKYGKNNNYKSIYLTNHFWDETVKSEAHWHEAHQFKNLVSVLPLPQDSNVKLYLGAETDMDYNNVLGVSAEKLDFLDFVIVVTTHLHLAGNTVKKKVETPEKAAALWLSKLQSLLEKNLPWHKIGIAHLTCGHVFEKQTSQVISLLPDSSLYSVFSDCAAKGAGIELNMKTLSMTQEEKAILLRPYYIAKDCGCKFYLGSDAHKLEALDSAKENFKTVITLLDLDEKDKFILKTQKQNSN